jgi:hypothetical protein
VVVNSVNPGGQANAVEVASSSNMSTEAKTVFLFIHSLLEYRLSFSAYSISWMTRLCKLFSARPASQPSLEPACSM